MVEYLPTQSFGKCIEKLTQFRTEGDKNPDKEKIGDTYTNELVIVYIVYSNSFNGQE